MGRKGRPPRIDDVQAEECRRLYESGLTLKQIAASLGVRDDHTVARAICRAGGALRGHRRREVSEQDRELRLRYESGDSIRVLAARFEIGKGAARNAILRAGGQLRSVQLVAPSTGKTRMGPVLLIDETHAQECRRLYESGLTLKEVAAQIGVRSHKTVTEAIKRVGGTIRKRSDYYRAEGARYSARGRGRRPLPRNWEAVPPGVALTMAEAAVLIGVSQTSLRRMHLGRNPAPIPPDVHILRAPSDTLVLVRGTAEEARNLAEQYVPRYTPRCEWRRAKEKQREIDQKSYRLQISLWADPELLDYYLALDIPEGVERMRTARERKREAVRILREHTNI